ncbi:MAG TPA: tRNA (adenosine(37)-N6)-threonylcarbamoyltransferase complex dimerization subunit type 1 TsaB [Steroidobacteraceae bacterium]|jgi:tRNA threonylcarbamoyladenosine biosynthesis protein TsaB
MKILALDTATEACSASLLIDGEVLSRELELGRGHAEQILPMIDELLAEAALALSKIDAIAFGRGPGGFTGVRLAASVTQGLAFAADIPVVPVSDLAAVAQKVLALRPEAGRVLVCNDARMQEVYWGCFERGPADRVVLLGEERVGPPGKVNLPGVWLASPVYGAGRGFAAYPPLPERLAPQLAALEDRLLPSAREIAFLAVPEVIGRRTVAAEQAIPVYLRDNVASPAR